MAVLPKVFPLTYLPESLMAVLPKDFPLTYLPESPGSLTAVLPQEFSLTYFQSASYLSGLAHRWQFCPRTSH